MGFSGATSGWQAARLAKNPTSNLRDGKMSRDYYSSQLFQDIAGWIKEVERNEALQGHASVNAMTRHSDPRVKQFAYALKLQTDRLVERELGKGASVEAKRANAAEIRHRIITAR